MHLKTQVCWTTLWTNTMKAEEKSDKNWAHAFTDPGQTIACVIKAAENNPGINYTLDSAADVCTPFSLLYKETGWKTKHPLLVWADVFQRGWMEFFVGLFLLENLTFNVCSSFRHFFRFIIFSIFSQAGGASRPESGKSPTWCQYEHQGDILWSDATINFKLFNFFQNGKLISKIRKREVRF